MDAPSLNIPLFGAGGGRPQVLEGDFCGPLLSEVRKMGLDVAVSANAMTPHVPRGYVISGYLVGAWLDPKGGYQAVATDALNARALGY